MARFGVQVRQEGWQRFVIPAESRYTSPGRIAIEGDASTASYFMALGAIGGGPIHILGAGSDSMQGDMAFADVVQEMGATVVRHADSIEVGSEEHTSEIQSLMRIAYAVFCMKKKTNSILYIE